MREQKCNTTQKYWQFLLAVACWNIVLNNIQREKTNLKTFAYIYLQNFILLMAVFLYWSLQSSELPHINNIISAEQFDPDLTLTYYIYCIPDEMEQIITCCVILE